MSFWSQFNLVIQQQGLNSLAGWAAGVESHMAECLCLSIFPGNLPALHWMSCEGITVILISWEQTWKWTTTCPTQPCNTCLCIKGDRHISFLLKGWEFFSSGYLFLGLFWFGFFCLFGDFLFVCFGLRFLLVWFVLVLLFSLGFFGIFYLFVCSFISIINTKFYLFFPRELLTQPWQEMLYQYSIIMINLYLMTPVLQIVGQMLYQERKQYFFPLAYLLMTWVTMGIKAEH